MFNFTDIFSNSCTVLSCYLMSNIKVWFLKRNVLTSTERNQLNMFGIVVLLSCLSVNGKLVLAFQQKSSFYDSSPTHFNRAVCHGSQTDVNFIKLTSRPGQLTVSALNFGAWMFFTGCVPQVVIKKMPDRTLANHFGLRLIRVYVKRRALSNNS